MANSITTQVIEDGERYNITRVDFLLDTSNASETLIVDFPGMSLTHPPSSEVRLERIWYSIQDPIEVRLMWQADTSTAFMDIAGRGDEKFWVFGGLTNTATTGKTGSITMLTNGWASGSIGGSMVFQCVKCSSTTGLAAGRLLTESSDSLQAETGAFINIG